MGGSRGAAYANTFQTIVFMIMGVVAFVFIINALGGIGKAGEIPARITEKGVLVQDYRFDKESGELLRNDPPKPIGKVLSSTSSTLTDSQPHFAREPVKVELKKKKSENGGTDSRPRIGNPVHYLCHLPFHTLERGHVSAFISTLADGQKCQILPLDGDCPPLMHHGGLGALRLGRSLGFRGLATGYSSAGGVKRHAQPLVGDPPHRIADCRSIGQIMSSLDSQFLCLGTIFTNDIVVHRAGKEKYSDKQIIRIARAFIISIVALTYALAMLAKDANVFDLAIWCFSGFSALFPVVFAALYWKRATKEGAIASIVGAVVTWLYYFHQSGYGGEYMVGPGIVPAAICFAVSAGLMVVVSLSTKPPSSKPSPNFSLTPASCKSAEPSLIVPLWQTKTKLIRQLKNSILRLQKSSIGISPETGSPFWLNWAAEQSWNPLEEVRTFKDLCEKFPNFEDEWLRDQPNEVWVPKAYEGRPFNIFETGGTTGMPKQRIGWDDFRIDYTAFSETLSDEHFPETISG